MTAGPGTTTGLALAGFGLRGGDLSRTRAISLATFSLNPAPSGRTISIQATSPPTSLLIRTLCMQIMAGTDGAIGLAPEGFVAEVGDLSAMRALTFAASI